MSCVLRTFKRYNLRCFLKITFICVHYRKCLFLFLWQLTPPHSSSMLNWFCILIAVGECSSWLDLTLTSCAELSFSLAVAHTCTPTHQHTEMHACTHTRTHTFSCIYHLSIRKRQEREHLDRFLLAKSFCDMVKSAVSYTRDSTQQDIWLNLLLKYTFVSVYTFLFWNVLQIKVVTKWAIFTGYEVKKWFRYIQIYLIFLLSCWKVALAQRLVYFLLFFSPIYRVKWRHIVYRISQSKNTNSWQDNYKKVSIWHQSEHGVMCNSAHHRCVTHFTQATEK